MVFVYGACNGNARAARFEYLSRFPSRRQPRERLFSTVWRRLRETGSFSTNESNHRAGGRTIRSIDQEESVIRAIHNNPESSTRRIGARVGCSNKLAWSVLKRNIN